MVRGKPGRRSATLLVMVPAVIAACGGGGSGGTEGPAPVQAITLAPAETVLYIGQQLDVRATLTDAGGRVLTDRAIAWASTDQAVASVAPVAPGGTGRVQALAEGTTIIAATSEGKGGTTRVSVQQVPVASVEVARQPTGSIVVGDRFQLVATVRDAGGAVLTRPVSWQSDDPSVVSVDQATGEARALAAGTTTVRATSGGRTGSLGVTVSAPPPTSAGCDQDIIRVPRGATGTVTCTVTLGATVASPITIGGTQNSALGITSAPLVTSIAGGTSAGTIRVPLAIHVAPSVPEGRYYSQLTLTQSGSTQTVNVPVDVMPSMPRVRAVYLVPADRSVQTAAPGAIERGLRHLQIFYQNALGIGKTFAIATPAVEVLHTSHAADWYLTNPNGPANLTFWNNALADAFALTGARFNDPDYVWLIYIDVEPAADQLYGGTSGVALLPRHDVLGISGQDPQAGTCRWVGGLGHELGHAFGLPHPPGCDAGSAECVAGALMWLGYLTYPTATVSDAERQSLSASRFFSAASRVTTEPFGCASTGGAALAGTPGFRWRTSPLGARDAALGRRPDCGYGALPAALRPRPPAAAPVGAGAVAPPERR